MERSLRALATEGAAAVEVSGRHALALTQADRLRARVGQLARRRAPSSTKVSLAELEACLARLGLEPGHDLLLHSSWDGLAPLGAKPSQLVELLRSYAGPRATLLAPSHPVDVVKEGHLHYDVERSPTRMGLVSETLRRTAGARRSPFPIAPIVAVGPAAEEYTADFRRESNDTPYGEGSPWVRAGTRGARVLILGVPYLRAITLLHCAFDRLPADRLPVRDFHVHQTFRVVQRGRAELWTVRRQNAELEERLATVAFGRLIEAAGLVRRASLGNIEVSMLDASRFLAWHLDLAAKTGMPYWRPGRTLFGGSGAAR